MPNTYTQIYIHAVFAVRYRASLIDNRWKADLFKYIAGIVRAQGHKSYAINGMPDHVHLFVSMNPVQSLSDLMQDVKGSSSKWINENKLTRGKFNWQAGYGAFTYSHSHIDAVVKYILNQEKHHSRKTFREEYVDLLDKFKIDYDGRYVFKDPE
jgi:REP element-mobilizing transposase RayT